MKKIIFIMAAMMLSMAANAQNWKVNASVDYVFDPSLYDVSINGVSAKAQGHQYGVNAGVGYNVGDGFYIGIGSGFFGYTVHEKVSGYGYKETGNENLSIIPLYFDMYRMKPQTYFYEAKIGCAFMLYDGAHEANFFIDVLPVGYTFSNGFAVAVGYRFLADDDAINGIAATVKYQF